MGAGALSLLTQITCIMLTKSAVIFLIACVVAMTIYIAILLKQLVEIMKDFYDELMYTDSSVKQTVENKKQETPDKKATKRSYRSWADQARDNEILVPGSRHTTTLQDLVPLGTIVRKTYQNENAFAEVVALNEKVQKGEDDYSYRYLVQILPLDAYPYVKKRKTDHHMAWITDYYRGVFSALESKSPE